MASTGTGPGRVRQAHRSRAGRGATGVPLVPVLVALLITAVGCAGGGTTGAAGGGEVASPAAGSSSAAEVGTSGGPGAVGRPEVSDDGRMLQPAGHSGLWFETEPEDPLDHLVWESQRYVGSPVPVRQLGADAGSPEGAHLPDVCAPEVVQRMVDLGFRVGSERDVGADFVQCSVFGADPSLKNDGVGFFWGSHSSVEKMTQNHGTSYAKINGVETFSDGDLAMRFGCVSMDRFTKDPGAVFAYFATTSKYDDCESSTYLIQVLANIMGDEVDRF